MNERRFGEDESRLLFTPQKNNNKLTIDNVLQTMQQYASQVDVQRQGCVELARWAQASSRHQSEIGRLHGVEIIVQALQSQEGTMNAPLQHQAFFTLCDLCHHHEGNQARVLRVGGIPLALKALENFPSVADVQQSCCGFLAEMVDHHAAKLKRKKHEALFDLLVKAVKNNPSNGHLVQNALEVLSILPLTTTQDLHQFTLTTGKTLPRILSNIMEDHSDSTSIQANGCAILATFFAHAKTRSGHHAFGKKKSGSCLAGFEDDDADEAADLFSVTNESTKHAISAVFRSMKQNPDDVKVQEKGCTALKSLIEWSALNQLRIAHKGGIDLITAAMRRHDTSLPVQSIACRTLSSLLLDLDYRLVREAVAGGVASVVSAVLYNTFLPAHRPPTEEESASSTSSSSSSSSSSSYIGIIRAVVSALLNHERDVMFQVEALRVLKTLAGLHEPSRWAMAQDRMGVIEAITSSMRVFQRQSAEIQEVGCTLLASIATYNSEYQNEEGRDRRGITTKTGAQPGAVTDRADEEEEKEDCLEKCPLAAQVGTTARMPELKCLILSKVAANARGHRMAQNSRVVRSIVEAMRNFPNTTAVQVAGCRALSNMGMNDRNGECIARLGGIDLVMTAMRRHPRAVSPTGYDILATLASRSETIRKQIVDKGGINLILRTVAMRNHTMEDLDIPHDPEDKEDEFGALASLLDRGMGGEGPSSVPPSFDENVSVMAALWALVEKASRLDGALRHDNIAVTITSLVNVYCHEDVAQKIGFSMLRQLIGCCHHERGETTTTASATTGILEGGVKAKAIICDIVDSMRVDRKSVGLIDSAISILEKLTTLRCNVELLGRHGGIDLIMAAMHNCFADGKIQLLGQTIFFRLACCGPEFQKRLVSSGIIDHTVDYLLSVDSDEEEGVAVVVRACLKTLLQCSSHQDQSRERMTAVGVAFAVTRIMQRSARHHVGVHLYGCYLLSNLTCNMKKQGEDFLRSMAIARGADVIVLSLRKMLEALQKGWVPRHDGQGRHRRQILARGWLSIGDKTEAEDDEDAISDMTQAVLRAFPLHTEVQRVGNEILQQLTAPSSSLPRNLLLSPPQPHVQTLSLLSTQRKRHRRQHAMFCFPRNSDYLDNRSDSVPFTSPGLDFSYRQFE